MKACVFQKQEPVDIPQVETRTLKDVLELPWGFEIYSLLTRWNPLNFARPVPGRRRAIRSGGWAGPAGFTLAHHLMNDGHTVVGDRRVEDRAACRPRFPAWMPHGQPDSVSPDSRYQRIHESLDDRVMAGFGGVAEYGITVRWNKNFLKMIRLLLERRREFSMFGGVRFGGTHDHR